MDKKIFFFYSQLYKKQHHQCQSFKKSIIIVTNNLITRVFKNENYSVPIWFLNTPLRNLAGYVFYCIGVVATIYMCYIRYNMRKKLNIKTTCIHSYGEVGGMFEDIVCLSVCGPCAMSQMHEEMDVTVAYCCSGKDPGYSDANLIA